MGEMAAAGLATGAGESLVDEFAEKGFIGTDGLAHVPLREKIFFS